MSDYHSIPILNRYGATVGYARVSPEDSQRIGAYRWFLTARGKYAVRYIDGDRHRMHWDVLGHKYIDHIDGDGLNNTRANLRPATTAENLQNRPKANANSKTGVRGVCFYKGKYRAHAKLNRKLYNLGSFPTVESAAIAVSRWRAEHMPFAVEGDA